MKRNILLLEDNEKSRKYLVKLLNEMQEDIHVLEAESMDMAYSYAMQYSIHLFLLDIVIDTSVHGDASGIVFATRMKELDKYKKTPVIFITSLEDPKLFAYSELHCYQYIEKPFDEERTLAKIREALELELLSQKEKSIIFRNGGILFPIIKRNIKYIVCEKPITRIVMIDDSLEVSYRPIKKILIDLDSEDFLQCSRSMLVNIKFVHSIDNVNNYLKLKDTDELFPLGDIYRKRLIGELEDG